MMPVKANSAICIALLMTCLGSARQLESGFRAIMSGFHKSNHMITVYMGSIGEWSLLLLLF